MNYRKYLQKTGLTNRDVVAILQPHFPKFTKIQCSMLAHPELYGLSLSREAAAKLPPLTEKRAAPRRRKANRLVVYLDDGSFENFSRLLQESECESQQQLLEKILKEKMEVTPCAAPTSSSP